MFTFIPYASNYTIRRTSLDPRLFSVVLLAAFAWLAASLMLTPPTISPPSVSRSPLAFVPNRGQSDPQVRFEASSLGGTAFFTEREIVLALPYEQSTNTLRIAFDGAASQPVLTAEQRLPGVMNLIQGDDRANWQVGLPTYAELRYHEIYPGITLQYEGFDGFLKSTFAVAPGSNPANIQWHYNGASHVQIVPASGDLQITLAADRAPLIERAPIAWQDVNGSRIPVVARFELRADGSVGFALGSYNPSLPLTIDPTLEYSTYMGGTGADRIHSVAIDSASGDVFVVGETSSSPFPGSPTAIGTTGPGSFPNVFVARVKADGSATLYRTIIGGTNTDIGRAIAVNGGIAAVTGNSYSNNFPTQNALDSTYNGDADIFVLTLDATGNLTYGTYAGGNGADLAYGIAAQGNNLLLVGTTDGLSFGTPQGGTDALVLKIDKTQGAAGLVYSQRLGGFFTDRGLAIAADSAGAAYVTGTTQSDGASATAKFPIAGSPLQTNSGGSADAFITKIDSTGTVVYSSFIGGNDFDEGLGIAVLPAGDNVYLTGRTLSSDFPSAIGALSGQDAFVFQLNLNTNTIGYSRYLGSPGVDQGNAIALDNTNAAYVVGSTSSTSFFELNPLTEMAGQGGNSDGFLTRFDAIGTPSYSTRLGGSSDDFATGVATIATAAGEKIYVGGYTNSNNFLQAIPPTTIQPTFGGSDDGFLVRIANARPIVDLNDNTPANGIDFGPVTWTEAGGATAGTGAVAVVSTTGLSVADPDSPKLAYAEVRFVASSGTAATPIVPAGGAAESLGVTLSGGITGSYSAGTGVLRLTAGVATTRADFQTVLRTITYNNSANAPSAGTRTLAFEVNDGIDGNNPFAISTVNVVASNDPPALTVPGSPTVTEDIASSISGISVADVDAGNSAIQVTLSVPVAAGTLSATNGGGSAVVTGSGTASLTITGAQTEINTALGTLQFTGALDFNGSVTLSVGADDQGNTPAPALTDSKTVSITVSPANDAPVIPSSPPSVTVVEDTPKTISITTDLGMSDAKDTTSPPAAAGAASFPPVTSINVLTPPTNGALSAADIIAGTFVYTPNSNVNGSDSFQIRVCDQGTPGSACSNLTVNVTITAVNDPPSFTKGADVTVLEDSGAYSGAGWATALSTGPSNESGQTLAFTVNNDNTSLFSTQPAIAANGTLSFTPAANASGSATVTVHVQDNGGTANGGNDTSADQTFTITITPVNDVPSFTKGADVTVLEDSGAYSASWATSVTAGPNESGQTISFVIVTNSNAGLFSSPPAVSANGTLTFTPATNANGSATITLHATDNGGVLNGGQDTSTPDQSFVINVTAVNDPPSFTKGADVTVAEDSGAYSGAAWATAISPGPSDESGQTVSFNLTNTNNSLFSVQPAIAANGTLSFTPAANGFGSATVTVSAQDNGGTANSGNDTSVGQTFTITITSVNDGAPIVVADSDTTTEDTAKNITVTTNDSDPADAPFGGVNPQSVSIGTPPANGTATVNPSTGVITYTPATNYNGSDSFTYTVCDIESIPANVLCSAPAIVTITITPANDPPTAVAETVTTPEDGGAIVVNVLANDTDAPDNTGETLTVTAVTQPLYGTVTLVASVVSYTPQLNYYGPDSFTYTISDGNGGTATATVTLTVTPTNDPPTATNDQANVPKNSSNNQISVLANDSFAPDLGETLSVTAVGIASHGTVTIAPGGVAVLYTPATGYEGPDSFTYTVSDNNGGSTTATVDLMVGKFNSFLPLVLGKPIPPDLVVTDFHITPAGPTIGSGTPVQISVTVKNNGTSFANAFWVDFYMNPSTPPTAANTRWDVVCTLKPCRGIAWFVKDGLRAGESIILTSTPDSYDPSFTRWDGSFAAGVRNLYVYADSWNGSVPYGAVDEGNETNNRAEILGLTVASTIQQNNLSDQPELPLPERPQPIDLLTRREAGMH